MGCPSMYDRGGSLPTEVRCPAYLYEGLECCSGRRQGASAIKELPGWWPRKSSGHLARSYRAAATGRDQHPVVPTTSRASTSASAEDLRLIVERGKSSDAAQIGVVSRKATALNNGLANTNGRRHAHKGIPPPLSYTQP